MNEEKYVLIFYIGLVIICLVSIISIPLSISGLFSPEQALVGFLLILAAWICFCVFLVLLEKLRISKTKKE